MRRLDPNDPADRIAIARNAAGIGLVLCLMAVVVLGYVAARHPFLPLRIAGGVGALGSLFVAAFYASRFRAANFEIEEARRQKRSQS